MLGDLYPKFSFREMAKRDLRRVHGWRNHLSIRETTSSYERIPFNKHCDWFNSTSDTLKLIFEVNQKPEGVVIYDKSTSYWSFYLRPNGRSHCGLGRLMLSMFLVYAKRVGIKLIKAKIAKDNIRSVYLHRSLDFEYVSVKDNQHYCEKNLCHTYLSHNETK